MLELSEVTKRFDGTGFVLDKVSFTLGKGLHVLVGPNGAGKSTLLRIVATIARADAGRVLFDGQDVYSDLRGYKLNLGYLPQSVGFYDHMTGIEFLQYMASLKGISPRARRERVDAVVELLGLDRHCARKINNWSVGLKQRLGLAQALLNDPAVLVLDEPLCGLDPEEADEVGQLIARLARDKVIFISSHIIEGLAVNRLLLIVNGILKFIGLPTVFVDESQGRVWSVETSKEEGIALQKKYPVSSVVFQGNQCRCVVISDDKPDIPGAKATSPSLEDAYIYWLRHCRINGDERDGSTNR